MELDKRIKEGKKPFDCIDAESEEVKSFIGKKGYFADHISEFKNISDITESVLKDIAPKNLDYEVYDAGCTYWQYFLPAEWVKEPEEPEKKYRPYTLAEWVNSHEIGEVIHCRNEHKQEFHVMYTGYVIDNGEEDIQDNRTTGRIMLINMGYLLQELFERYEICINGIWQPFGVIEDKE